MSAALLTKIEIDVMQANELEEAVDLTVKYQFPAMVVHPVLAEDSMFKRVRRQGRFKIITPVDWPKGDTYGERKLRGLTSFALDTDGFEIALTRGRTTAETAGEIHTLYEHIKTEINPRAEIRFVIGCLSAEDDSESLYAGFVGRHMPDFVRNDLKTKLQASRANADIHKRFLASLRLHVQPPVKISGNLGSVRSLTSLPDAQRFGLSLVQAKAVLAELQGQPDALRDILA